MLINVHNNKHVTEDMKWNIMALNGNLGMSDTSNLAMKNELSVVRITHFLYINGYKEPVLTFWKTFKPTLCNTPSYCFNLFDSSANQVRISYV